MLGLWNQENASLEGWKQRQIIFMIHILVKITDL